MVCDMHRFDKRALSGADTILFAHPITARFQDVDAAGIVFYARIVTWFHDAYFAFLASAGIDMPALIADGEVIAPMAHVEADYFSPVRFGDAMLAEIVAAHVDGAALALGFRLVRSDEKREVVSVGQQVHLCVDRRTMTRVDVPADLVAGMQPLLDAAAPAG